MKIIVGFSNNVVYEDVTSHKDIVFVSRKPCFRFNIVAVMVCKVYGAFRHAATSRQVAAGCRSFEERLNHMPAM